MTGLDGKAAPPASASVARGGAINLVGAAVYGLANFILLFVLTRSLGVTGAGSVLIAIAIFQISSKIAELGCATGFIRWISHHRATGRSDLLRATVVVGLVPVALVASALALGLWLASPILAEVFGGAGTADSVAAVVRGMAPFLPASAVYSVLVQGTRGFDTMLPQTVIERVGRALALPLVVFLGFNAGLGPVGVGVLWAATNLIALVPAAVVFVRLVSRAADGAGLDHTPVEAQLVRDFWSFTGPRAVGQMSEVAVVWLDTVLVGALVSTSAAGIYASGTRYLLPGAFTSDALMQVTGPRVSGLVAAGKRSEASAMVSTVTSWQTMLLWPVYLLVIAFAPVLLRLFGPEVVEAQGALIALSVAVLITALVGPASSVVLMSGRSRQQMFNTLLLLTVNVAGNLLLVPQFGITAAGVVWAVTIVIGAMLPAWQAHRSLGITTSDRRAVVLALAALLTVGLAAGVGRLFLGDTIQGLVVATVLGMGGYVGVLWPRRHALGVSELVAGFRPGVRAAPEWAGPEWAARKNSQLRKEHDE